jgi:hypothetical protein
MTLSRNAKRLAYDAPPLRRRVTILKKNEEK